MTSSDQDRGEAVMDLVGIYDADGSLVGELRYVVGRQLGTAHCALCDITHGTFRERAGWRAARATLPVPFVALHRDECDEALRLAAGGFPAVLARLTGGSARLLLGAEDLEALGGQPEALVAAIRERAASLRLRWPHDHW